MKHKEDYFCLVIAGAWNIAIFTPEWVSKYLFEGAKVNIEFPTNNPISSPRFSTEDLRVSVVGNRLMFSAINSTDVVFKSIEDLALKVSQYLEHTPVLAFGINSNFQTPANKELEKLFISDDSAIYEEANFALTEETFVRKFKKDGYTLTTSIGKGKDFYSLDFNYQYNITSLLQFKEIFTPDIIASLKNDSLMLLDRLYGLKLDS